MRKRVFFCGKCFTLLDNPNEKCPVCEKYGDVRSIIKEDTEQNELAEEIYSFLVNEDLRLETVKRELEKISEHRDKFLQKLESLLENREELDTESELNKYLRERHKNFLGGT